MRFEIQRTDDNQVSELTPIDIPLRAEDTMILRDRAAIKGIISEQGSPLFRILPADTGVQTQLRELHSGSLPPHTYFLVEQLKRDLLRQLWWNFTYTFPLHGDTHWGEFVWWAPQHGASHTKDALFRDATVVESLFRHRFWEQILHDPALLRQPAQELLRIVSSVIPPRHWEQTRHHLRTNDASLKAATSVLSGKNTHPTR